MHEPPRIRSAQALVRRHPVGFSLRMLALTILAAYACAAAYIAAIQLSLPSTDLAARQSFWLAYIDPFVLSVAVPVATIVGVALFPVELFSLWHRDVLRGGLLVLGVTLLYLVAVTPFSQGVGLFGAPVVAIAALSFCRLSDFAFLRPQIGPGIGA